MNWDELLPKYFDYLTFEKEHSKYKINDYRKKFKWFSERLPFPFTLNEARLILIEMKRNGLADTYIHYNTTAINSFIRWCQLEKLPQEDFCDELNKLRPKIDRTPDANDLLSVEEVQLLIVNPQNRPIAHENFREYFKRVDDMYSLLFEFNYKTACRSGEALNLKKNCFNFSNHSVTFYKTKTGEDRTVAIPPDMEDKLKEYMKDINPTQYIFVRNTNDRFEKVDNKPVTQEMANRAFKYRGKLAGIERDLHVHMLRHSAITHMQLQGCPLATVQRICGHKRLATTQLYTHVMVEDQREAMLRYNPLIKSQDPSVIFKLVKEYIAKLQPDPDLFLFNVDNDLKPTKLLFSLK